ncbi:unnamed protein product, partial [marine sediment metagenome]
GKGNSFAFNRQVGISKHSDPEMGIRRGDTEPVS